eukprot:TRINITY_DN3934_c0_g2_i1.p1 TRINITY_DN3934_c0_g2~~TRINITY_DN3934_c0_g2_i1.p1  ORF type:complete len:442 (-),score=147.60 TRINITY_DN3934_c0_g2_i1:8-1333(-)
MDWFRNIVATSNKKNPKNKDKDKDKEKDKEKEKERDKEKAPSNNDRKSLKAPVILTPSSSTGGTAMTTQGKRDSKSMEGALTPMPHTNPSFLISSPGSPSPSPYAPPARPVSFTPTTPQHDLMDEFTLIPPISPFEIEPPHDLSHRVNRRSSLSIIAPSKMHTVLVHPIPNLNDLVDSDNVLDSPTTIKEREEFKRLITEYQRKIQVLTSALEEKAENTVSLAHQSRSDENTIKDLTLKLTNLEAEREKLVRDNAVEDLAMAELNRRTETMTRSLEVLAIENVELQALIPLDEGDNVRAVFEEKERNDEFHMDPGTVQLLSGAIEELEFKIKNQLLQLETFTQRNKDAKEQLDSFEKKIAKLQQKGYQTLIKEAQRRKAAEFESERLMKKVEELEKLQDGDDTSSPTSVSEQEEDSDVEQDENTQASPQNQTQHTPPTLHT